MHFSRLNERKREKKTDLHHCNLFSKLKKREKGIEGARKFNNEWVQAHMWLAFHVSWRKHHPRYMFLILATHYNESDRPFTVYAHTGSQPSFHCPFPEVTTSQHASLLPNSHHFSSHSGIICPDQEAPGPWTQHFYAEKPNSYSLIFLFSGVGWELHPYSTTVLMVAHRPSSLCTFQ